MKKYPEVPLRVKFALPELDDGMRQILMSMQEWETSMLMSTMSVGIW